MHESSGNQLINFKNIASAWKDLYKISGITTFIMAILMILGVICFFIWPHLPGYKSTSEIFNSLQNDKLGGLVGLDLFMLISNLFAIGLFIGLYISLKQINQSLALIALILGLISVIALLPARPIFELLSLSDRYTAATTAVEKNYYLATGEALLVFFTGTAYLVFYIFGTISSLVSSFLMLRSTIFGKVIAYLGIITSISAFGIFIPVIGMVLGLIAMPGIIMWNFLVALKFFRLGWPKGNKIPRTKPRR